jgi:cytochrome b6-f complex iron-sulfur subunit
MSHEFCLPKSENGDRINRETFLRVAIGGIGLCYAAVITYPVYRYLQSPIEKAQAAAMVTEVTLPEAKKLPAGSALMFKFGSRPAMLIHHRDDSWVALEAVCSHLGCTVQYESAANRIFCACHGGVYDPRSGANVSGPPPKPLRRLAVKVDDNGIVVSKTPPSA